MPGSLKRGKDRRPGRVMFRPSHPVRWISNGGDARFVTVAIFIAGIVIVNTPVVAVFSDVDDIVEVWLVACRLVVQMRLGSHARPIRYRFNVVDGSLARIVVDRFRGGGGRGDTSTRSAQG
jgi:hypothetical protein